MRVLRVEMTIDVERDTPSAPMRDQPRNKAALLIIDMINRFDFEGAGELRTRINAVADTILELRGQADAAEVPVIYVNDNFGEWHSERSRLVEQASQHAVAAQLAPRASDYFVIKPQFSGFYATNLPVLLPKLGVDRLVLTGVATEICVLFTAADAHMRDYGLWVPSDAVGAVSRPHGEAALEIMSRTMDVEIAPTQALSLTGWVPRSARPSLFHATIAEDGGAR